MEPPAPAGTMAAFATTLPSNALSVETDGWVCPAGHVVRKASGPAGTTVMFSEYAWAAAGIPQDALGMAKDPVCPPAIDGPPNGPAGNRVSAMRQGATG